MKLIKWCYLHIFLYLREILSRIIIETDEERKKRVDIWHLMPPL